VLGTSRGGLIAMAMAMAAPQRLAGAILNDVGPVIATDGIARIINYVGHRPAFADLDTAADRLAVYHAGQFPGVSRDRWRTQAAAQYVQAANGLDLRYDPMLRQALLDQAEAAQGPVDLWPLFEALKPIPTGVLRGANSDLLTAATLAEMQGRHPGMATAVIPDRGHVPFLDEPGSLALIRQVLEQAA
jgi:pimeloyl-ACP methyl ester carboxylesterase